MGFTPSRRVNGSLRSLEHRPTVRRKEILIKDGDIVITRVALSPDKPRSGVDHDSFQRQQLTDTRIVGHVGKGARVGAAATPAASAAIVGRLMRIVQTDRAVAENEDQR